MTPADAAKILDLPLDATPEQLEARFLELRRKLEDKIAKAPTPGLQAKYRESLAEITLAAETLTLAADSSALPVTQKQGAGSKEQGVQTSRSQHSDTAFSPSSKLPAPGSSRRKSGGKEFLLVAVIAVLVLAAGGWLVMKTRADNAEKARIAAEAKAAADKAAEEKRLAAETEKARQEQLAVQLRTQLAEAKIAWEIAEREERDAERRMSDLRSDLRGLRDPKPEVVAELNLRLDSAQRYSTWLRDYLLRHPLKVARAKLEEMLQGGAVNEAGAAGDEVRRLTQSLQADLGASPGGLAVLTIATNLPTARWELTGPLDFKQTGTGPLRVTGLFFARYDVIFSHATFDNKSLAVTLEPGRANQADHAFPFIRVTIKGILPGDRLEADYQPIFPLPDGTYAVTNESPVGWLLHRSGHLPCNDFTNWSEKDTSFEYRQPVPLQPRPLVDAALKILAGSSPRERVGPLINLLEVGMANRLIAPDERSRLLRDTIKAINDEPMPQSAEFAVTEPRERLQARLDLAAVLLLTDPAAAKTVVEESFAVFRTLSDKDKVALSVSAWIMASQRGIMPEFIRLMQAALEADPAAFKTWTGMGPATALYGLLHLHDRGTEAEAWKSSVLARRDPSTQGSDSNSFAYWKSELPLVAEAAGLRSALQRGDYVEFSRLARAWSGDTAPSASLVDDLLNHGFERQALDLAVSVNSTTFQTTILDYATMIGRLSLLEDYHTRVRAKNRPMELNLAEVFALSGNLTKARTWLERAGDLAIYREPRLFALAQLGDLPAARKLFDELDKEGIKLAATDPTFRLPRFVATARLLGEPAREQKILELAGLRDFKLNAEWLMRIGDLDEALAYARNSRQPISTLTTFYRYFTLRNPRGDLPWIGAEEAEIYLIIAHLHRLNRPRAPAVSIDLPYPRTTPAYFRETMTVPYPPAMQRSGLAGEARIIINIDSTGRATDYTTVRTPHAAFAEAMFKIAAEKGFHPALENGRPVAGTYEMSRNFRL